MRTTYILGGIAALVLIGIVLSAVLSSSEDLTAQQAQRWRVRKDAKCMDGCLKHQLSVAEVKT